MDRRQRAQHWLSHRNNLHLPRSPSGTATLSIVKSEDCDWRIGELELRGNTNVSAITRIAVESWLDQYALSV